MHMQWLLIGLTLSLVCDLFDSLSTYGTTKLCPNGANIEANVFVRLLLKRFGFEWGSVIGLIIFHFVLILMGLLFYFVFGFEIFLIATGFIMGQKSIAAALNLMHFAGHLNDIELFKKDLPNSEKYKFSEIAYLWKTDKIKKRQKLNKMFKEKQKFRNFKNLQKQ